jgi:hypothetical protein
VNSIVGTAASLGFSTNFAINSTQPGFNSAMRLRDGFPTLTRPTVDQLGAGFGAVAPGRAPNTAVTFFERSRPTPVSYQYNLSLQQELAKAFLVELGYIGNLSHHLTAPDLSINQVPFEKLGPGDAQSKRPFPQFSNVSVINPPLGNSAYHAGFMKIERRFHSGLTLLSHYTFSRFLDDARSLSELARRISLRKSAGLGPGQFGSSRKKEAAGAARWMPLPMGFECWRLVVAGGNERVWGLCRGELRGVDGCLKANVD